MYLSEDRDSSVSTSNSLTNVLRFHDLRGAWLPLLDLGSPDFPILRPCSFFELRSLQPASPRRPSQLQLSHPRLHGCRLEMLQCARHLSCRSHQHCFKCHLQPPRTEEFSARPCPCSLERLPFASFELRNVLSLLH